MADLVVGLARSVVEGVLLKAQLALAEEIEINLQLQPSSPRDIVFGLTTSVVAGALSKLQLAVREEASLPQRAERDIVIIADEMELIQSRLNVANLDEVEDNLKTWLRQVRELAYNFEDCVELVVSLEDRPTRCLWCRMLPSCTAATLPLDLVAAEIEHLKTRVEDVSSRSSGYVLLQNPASSGGTAATARDMLLEARNATKKHGFADLSHLIAQKGDGHHVIAVWGTAGDLGTTSVMRKAYNDPKICQKFTCRAWVKPVHPFNPHEFIRELTAQFYENSEELHDEAIRGFMAISEATQGDHVKEFVRHVNEVKYLIVLEDLSSLIEWNTIRTFLPDRKNGSWIIMSTQQFEVASLCVGHSYQALELKQFSIDHSVCALREGSHNDDGDKADDISGKDDVPDTSKTNTANDRVIKDPIIGRDSEIRELCQYTTNARSNNFQVIAVWGIAGVGKSALVKSLLCNRIISTGLFQKYGWVNVLHPLNLREFSRSLFLDFHSESPQVNGKIRIRNPIRECRDFLEQHHCLVVVDDLQSKVEWDLIQGVFLSRSSKSVVIVITTEVSIATYCTNKEDLVFNVRGLQADEAFDLFHQEVNSKNPLCPLKDLKEDVKLIELIVKCGGLPKIIVEIASILAEKTTTLMDTICSTSDRFMHTLETSPEYHSLRGLFDWMRSYFRTFPDTLKPCIFYMSLFPRDQSIRRRRVVRRWVAEGYSKDSEDKSAEQKGEIFFVKLLDLNIIQQPPQPATTLFGDTRMTLCVVNGFIHEYIVSQRMEENIAFGLGTSCNLTTQCAVRHLIIWESWNRDKIVFNNIDFSRLRSLTVLGLWKAFFISKSMKLLRVLDLENASGVKNDDLKDMVKMLSCLKFLSLRGCREIYSLPSSLGELRQLQTLDIRNTSIVNLPVTITKLHKLQYIRAGTSVTGEDLSTPHISLSQTRRRSHVVGIEVPRGIHKLTMLHTFGVVNVGESGGSAFLKEIECLSQLRKLGVSGINRKNSKKFSSAISGHLHLESLSVQLDKGSQGCLYGISLPLKSLQSLKLKGHVDKLPALEIDQLRKLTKLDLEMTILTEDDIKLIGSLPKLCSLRVKLFQECRVHFCINLNGLELPTYQKTKVLEITCSSSLDVTFGTKTMKSLELLKAHCYNGSTVKFSGLSNLTELKEVLIKGCCDEELNEDVQSQLLQHPENPVLKLEE